MIRVEAAGPVTRITLDRPKRRNALDWGMIEALGNALASVEADRAIRVVVITGAGATFCAGRDLDIAAAEGGLPGVMERDGAWTRIFEILHRLPMPSVAVVRGHAVAGGFTLAMACDFVVAERGSRFGAFEMRRGFPAAVNTPVLARLLGPRIALELLLLGEAVDADRLHGLGLVNRLADPGTVDYVADEFVARLAALDPDAVHLAKEAHRVARDMPHEAGLVLGKQLNALIAASGRIDEGARAFLAEKERG